MDTLADSLMFCRGCTYRFEIVVVQHKLCCGEAGFTLDGKFIAPMSNLGILDLLHDGTAEERTFVA